MPSDLGHGFSGETGRAWSWAGRVAQAWPELMRRLGYGRYVAQGGDVGAAVHGRMGRIAREGLLGSTPTCSMPALGGVIPSDTDEEGGRRAETFRATGFDYFLEQATRPQTIGYGLLDSPVALAAWMLDHDTDTYYKIAQRVRRREAVGQPHPGRRRDATRRRSSSMPGRRQTGERLRSAARAVDRERRVLQGGGIGGAAKLGPRSSG